MKNSNEPLANQTEAKQTKFMMQNKNEALKTKIGDVDTYCIGN